MDSKGEWTNSLSGTISDTFLHPSAALVPTSLAPSGRELISTTGTTSQASVQPTQPAMVRVETHVVVVVVAVVVVVVVVVFDADI